MKIGTLKVVSRTPSTKKISTTKQGGLSVNFNFYHIYILYKYIQSLSIYYIFIYIQSLKKCTGTGPFTTNGHSSIALISPVTCSLFLNLWLVKEVILTKIKCRWLCKCRNIISILIFTHSGLSSYMFSNSEVVAGLRIYSYQKKVQTIVQMQMCFQLISSNIVCFMLATYLSIAGIITGIYGNFW